MRGSRIRALLVAAVAFGILAPRAPEKPGPQPAPIAARPLPRFDTHTDTTRFGQLDYIGGFSYSSRNPFLEGVSSIRLSDGGRRFLAVTDTGFWFAGAIDRDAAGRPIGFSEASLAPILGPGGEASRGKGESDAEGLAIDGDRAIVSFERDHRIAAYRPASDPALARPTLLPLPIPRRELRANRGLEMIAASPRNSVLGGRLVTVTEQSIDRDGNLFAAILGNGGGIFKVRREEPWAVTDGAFLPDGDLLLLERRYEGFTRVGMRIRRIAGAAIRPGALVDGPVLMEADLAEEIDNMEGLDVFTAPDGSTRIALVSDDNGNFFQRNLYLEFRLAADEIRSN